MADLLNLHPEVKRRADRLVYLLRRLGYRVTVTSGYRSAAEQAALRRRLALGEQHLPVAPPGSSTHNYGLAVDLVTSPPAPARVLAAAGAASGLVWAGAVDPVHFDPFGFARWRAILRSVT